MSTTSIAGLRELAATMRALPAKIARTQLRKPVSDGAAVIRDDAQRRAPVDTGTLQQAILEKRDSSTQWVARYIVAVRHGPNARNTKKWGGVNLDAYYWTFVEFGTSKMAAEPFMRPAFEANKDEVLGKIVSELRSGVDAAVKELVPKQ